MLEPYIRMLDSRLKEIGFEQTGSDPSLYILANSEMEMFVVVIYVDDIILGGNTSLF